MQTVLKTGIVNILDITIGSIMHKMWNALTFYKTKNFLENLYTELYCIKLRDIKLLYNIIKFL